MAPLQIPLNFKFKIIFHVSSLLEDEGNQLSTQPTIVSFTNISPSQVASNWACEELSNQIPPKKWKLYKNSKKFQNVWIAYFLCTKCVIDEKGLVQQVKCKICTTIGRKEKLLAPKLDSLLKHFGHQKTKFSVWMPIHITLTKIQCMSKMNLHFLLLVNLLS